MTAWRAGVGIAIGLTLAASSLSAHGSTPTTTGTRALAASASGGQVKVTGWATFSGVNIAAGTDPRNDVGPTGDQFGTDMIGAQMVYRPELADLYIRWQVNKLPSTSLGAVNRVGWITTLYGVTTEFNHVPVEIRVQSQGVTQRFQLWSCRTEDACTPEMDLVGAFGTTGEEVVAVVKLSDLASKGLTLNEGSQIGTPFFYTANSPMTTPATIPPTLYTDTIRTGNTTRVTVPVKSVRLSAGKYSAKAALDKGYFTGYLPRQAFPRNPGTVTTKTCLGTRCVSQKFTVRV